MKTFDASKEFVVGKHEIGWVSTSFKELCKDVFLDEKNTPTFQTLPRIMTDAEIETELKPGICTLSDVLAFLKNPHNKSRDGNWNLFYLPSCVVRVFWYADDRRWRVNSWKRVGSTWLADNRVFSPATDTPKLESDTLSLESLALRLEKLERLFNPELLK